MVGERRFELPTSWSRTKRATRLRYSPNGRITSNESCRSEFPRMIKIQDLLLNVHIFYAAGSVDNFRAIKLRKIS